MSQINSKATAKRELELFLQNYSNGIVPLVGTQRAERNARIELLSLGDELSLIRVFDNPYDSNAVDVCDQDGYLVAHFTGDETKILAPIVESGQLNLKAYVAKLKKLSELPKDAKQAILEIKIVAE